MTSMVYFAVTTRDLSIASPGQQATIPAGTIGILEDHPSRLHDNVGIAIPFNGRVYTIFTNAWEPLHAPADRRPYRIAIETVTPRKGADLDCRTGDL